MWPSQLSSGYKRVLGPWIQGPKLASGLGLQGQNCLQAKNPWRYSIIRVVDSTIPKWEVTVPKIPGSLESVLKKHIKKEVTTTWKNWATRLGFLIVSCKSFDLIPGKSNKISSPASLITKILPMSFGLSVNQMSGIPRRAILPNIRFLNFIFSPNDSGLNDEMILMLVIRLWMAGFEIFFLSVNSCAARWRSSFGFQCKFTAYSKFY